MLGGFYDTYTVAPFYQCLDHLFCNSGLAAVVPTYKCEADWHSLYFEPIKWFNMVGAMIVRGVVRVNIMKESEKT